MKDIYNKYGQRRLYEATDKGKRFFDQYDRVWSGPFPKGPWKNVWFLLDTVMIDGVAAKGDTQKTVDFALKRGYIRKIPIEKHVAAEKQRFTEGTTTEWLVKDPVESLEEQAEYSGLARAVALHRAIDRAKKMRWIAETEHMGKKAYVPLPRLLFGTEEAKQFQEDLYRTEEEFGIPRN